ncbi:hypothetical protein BE04_26020, partial [Sorangium cellulosum]
WLDLVVGVDIHFEMVPTPALVPIPFPHPFVGLIFDPAGLAVSLALSNAIGMALGGSFKGPVLVNGMPATNTGTEAKNSMVLPHFVIPPGTRWTPMPKAPKPPTKPGAPPAAPDSPVAPAGDAVIIMGSKTVFAMGGNFARLGDRAMSCSEPVRLPSSAIVAIPKGAPVLVGGPPAIDWFAAVTAFIRTKSVANALHGLVGRIKSVRLRNLLHFAVCTLTGHPVDVASGRVMTRSMDFELPGPLPLRFERQYASSWSDRDGPLGPGWSHALDQAVWIEPGCVVLRTDDGREIEFDTMGLRDHVMRPGDEVFEPTCGLALRSLGEFRWEVRSLQGYVWRFEPLPVSPTMGRLVSIAHPQGPTIRLSYDDSSRLAWVHDCDGRVVRFHHDARGRLTGIDLPHPSASGFVPHVRYHYDEQGDLVAVTDALGRSTRYAYENHLLVRETDRNGFSFYFGYDGLGPEAYCVRTWGDGGVFDHELTYDKRNKLTVVTDSLGHATVWRFNAVGLPIERIDALGGTTSWEYDERTLLRTLEKDAVGRETRWTYDPRGLCTGMRLPDGAEITVVYDDHARRIAAKDATGGEWRWGYDRHGALAWSRDPVGRTIQYASDDGRLTRLYSVEDGDAAFAHDARAGVRTVRRSNGRTETVEFDRRGRPIRVRDARGVALELHYDALGRIVEARKPTGTRRWSYDGEGSVLEIADGRQHTTLRYSGFRWLASRTDVGGTRRLEYDTEGRLAAIVNEAGERWELERDPIGRIVAQIDFAGRRWTCKRNGVGDIVAIVRPSGMRVDRELDSMGRTVVERFSDGAVRSFEWDAAGLLRSASNANGRIELDRDALGRVVCERQDGVAVHSEYGVGGRIGLRTDLGLSIEIERRLDGWPRSVRAGAGAARLEVELVDLEGGQGSTFSSGAAVVALRSPEGLPTRLDLRDSRGWHRGIDYRYRDRRLAAIDDDQRGPTRIGYDRRGRPIQTERGDAVCVRTFDEAGNVYARLDREDRRYGSGGRLERMGADEVVHDRDGNVIERRTPAGVWRYEYDGAGLLVAVQRPGGDRVELGYDAIGRRIRKRTSAGEVRWLWDGSAPLQESAGDEGTTSWVFVPGTSVPMGRLRGAEAWGIATDERGSPQAVFDGGGRVLWSGALDLWGAPEADDGAPPIPWRFQGQLADPDTGLYHQRYRAYDPETGAYLMPDPIGVLGGLRPYGYVEDPLFDFDPLGLARCGPDEQPANSALIMLSNKHAAIRVVTEKGHMTSQLLMAVDDELFERLLKQAEREGPSAFNGHPTVVSAGLSDFEPHRSFVVFFESPEAAEAALKAQREALGSGGRYKLGENSCVTHVEDVLRAGGIDSNHGFMNSPTAGSFLGHVENVLNGVPQWW